VDSSGGTSDTYGVLSGLVNSSNKVYTVSLGSYISGSLRVYLNGQLQTQGSSEDWTETTPVSGTFTFATAPTTGDIIIAMYQFSSGATGNADTLDGLHSSSLALNSEWQNGWISAGETWTYASADDPTFTFTVAADVTTKYSAGMKIKLTQGTVKYFIITAVSTYSGGNTTITVYGGTDYDLADSAISANAYSMMKSPFGFPMSPAKWEVTKTDGTQRSQGTATASTWYNLGTTNCQISLPIGLWEVRYVVYATSTHDSASTTHQVTLSSANNSASDNQLTSSYYQSVASIQTSEILHTRSKLLTIAAKTTYYMNMRSVGGANITLYFQNQAINMVITAVCAYL
jgi:hypothetical protein